MRRMSLTPAFACALAALFAGCADEPPPPETLQGDLEGPIVEDPSQDHALKSGAVNCQRERATGYQSGRAFSIEVMYLDSKPVEVETGAAYWAMKQAAAADGVDLRIVSGFRTHAEQQYLYGCYVDCACNNCNLAAYPGYSNHQSGYALDLNTEGYGVYSWLSRNASRYGFQRTVPSEDWHWEYFGSRNTLDPCDDGDSSSQPPAASSSVRFKGLTEWGRYSNGVWLKVEADAKVHHVRYIADGDVAIGASEHRQDSFSDRYIFRHLGPHTITAYGYDAQDRKVGEATVKLEITEGQARQAEVSFEGMEERGWYRNGQYLKASASPVAASVDYYAGSHHLGTGVDASQGYAARFTSQDLGWRVLTAVARDRDGQELGRTSVTVRMLPGQDATPKVMLLSPDPGTRQARAVTLKAAASDGVKSVVYTSDGYLLGQSSDAASGFKVSYTFSRGGQRAVKLKALDAQGRAVAEQDVTLDLTP
jgi:hypothetical protein